LEPRSALVLEQLSAHRPKSSGAALGMALALASGSRDDSNLECIPLPVSEMAFLHTNIADTGHPAR
jgi:hypothetical protein